MAILAFSLLMMACLVTAAGLTQTLIDWMKKKYNASENNLE